MHESYYHHAYTVWSAHSNLNSVVLPSSHYCVMRQGVSVSSCTISCQALYVYSSSASSRVAIEFCLCSSGCDPASFFPSLPRQSAYWPHPDLILSFAHPPHPDIPRGPPSVPQDCLARPSLSCFLRPSTHDTVREAFPSPPTQLMLGSQVLTVS